MFHDQLGGMDEEAGLVRCFEQVIGDASGGGRPQAGVKYDVKPVPIDCTWPASREDGTDGMTGP